MKPLAFLALLCLPFGMAAFAEPLTVSPAPGGKLHFVSGDQVVTTLSPMAARGRPSGRTIEAVSTPGMRAMARSTREASPAERARTASAAAEEKTCAIARISARLPSVKRAASRQTETPVTTSAAVKLATTMSVRSLALIDTRCPARWFGASIRENP